MAFAGARMGNSAFDTALIVCEEKMNSVNTKTKNINRLLNNEDFHAYLNIPHTTWLEWFWS
jgi:hypothetical protein